MTYDWVDDEEDYDESDIINEFGNCPECGAEISVEAEMCPECGHWLTTAERHKLWDGGSQSKAVISMGKFLLVVLLVVLFLGSMLGIM